MNNERMKESIRNANLAGIPIYAESGGFIIFAVKIKFFWGKN